MRSVFISFFLVIFIFVGTGSVFAQTIDPCPANSVFSALCSIGIGNINRAVQSIITIILVMAVILAVIFLIWGGVKWILSGGDKQAVESARSMIIAAIVGLVLAFAAFFLFNIVLYLFRAEGAGSGLQIPRLI